MGDTLIALLAAKELGLIDEAEYDARLTRLMGTLNRLMLTETRTRDGSIPARRRRRSTLAASPLKWLVRTRHGSPDARLAPYR